MNIFRLKALFHVIDILNMYIYIYIKINIKWKTLVPAPQTTCPFSVLFTIIHFLPHRRWVKRPIVSQTVKKEWPQKDGHDVKICKYLQNEHIFTATIHRMNLTACAPQVNSKSNSGKESKLRLKVRSSDIRQPHTREKTSIWDLLFSSSVRET